MPDDRKEDSQDLFISRGQPYDSSAVFYDVNWAMGWKMIYILHASFAFANVSKHFFLRLFYISILVHMSPYKLLMLDRCGVKT